MGDYRTVVCWKRDYRTVAGKICGQINCIALMVEMTMTLCYNCAISMA